MPRATPDEGVSQEPIAGGETPPASSETASASLERVRAILGSRMVVIEGELTPWELRFRFNAVDGTRCADIDL
jgi:hypothetical protein